MLLLFVAGETPGGRRVKKWTDKCKACSQRCLRSRKKGRTLSQQYHAARGPLAEVGHHSKAKGFGARVSDAIGASKASVRASCSRLSDAVRASRASVRASASRASGALVRASGVARASMVVRRSSKPPLGAEATWQRRGGAEASASAEAEMSAVGRRRSRVPSLTPPRDAPGRRATVVRDGPGRRASLHRTAAMRRSIADAAMRPPSPGPGSGSAQSPPGPGSGSARSTGSGSARSTGSTDSARSTGSLGAEDEATLSPDEEEESPVAGEVGCKRGAKGQAGGEGGLHRVALAEDEEGDGDGGDSAASVAVYAAMQRGVEWRREQTKKHETTSPATGRSAPPRARRKSVAVAARGVACGAVKGTVKGTKAVAKHAAVAATGLLSPLPSPPSSPTSEPISEATPQLISSQPISDDLDEEARERLLGAIAFGRSANAARSERPPRIRQA